MCKEGPFWKPQKLNLVETDFYQACFQVIATRNFQSAKYVEASAIVFVSLCFSARAFQSLLVNQLILICWFAVLRQGLSVPFPCFPGIACSRKIKGVQ